MTDFRALCAELVAAIDAQSPHAASLLDRARAALAGPTDEQLLATYARALTAVVDNAPKPWPDDLVNRAQIAGLRAVINRYGSPTP